MSVSGPGHPHVQQRWYKSWRVLVPLALLMLFLYTYLMAGVLILYNYYWWTFKSEGVFRGAVPGQRVAPGTEPQVPKLLHQTWKDDKLPEKWKEAQQSCIGLHPDYKYHLWTDEEAELLIATKFPWFLDTYKSYPYSIQRADALRYFVLFDQGGIYLDLDVVCNKNLDYLRYYDFVAPKTYPIGVSNDILVAKPNADFALRLINQLPSWNLFLFVKYATVMFSTGPMFVTIQCALYAHKELVSILPVELYGKYKLTTAAMFKHLHGSSWHGSDGKYILWIDGNPLLFLMLVLLLLTTAATGLFVFCRHKSARHMPGAAYGLASSGLGQIGGGGVLKGPARKMTPP